MKWNISDHVSEINPGIRNHLHMHKKSVRAQNINTMGSFSFLLSLHQIGATFEFIKYNLNTLLIPSRKNVHKSPNVQTLISVVEWQCAI